MPSINASLSPEVASVWLNGLSEFNSDKPVLFKSTFAIDKLDRAPHPVKNRSAKHAGIIEYLSIFQIYITHLIKCDGLCGLTLKTDIIR